MGFFVAYITGKHTVLWHAVYVFMGHTVYLTFQNLGLVIILEAKMSGLSAWNRTDGCWMGNYIGENLYYCFKAQLPFQTGRVGLIPLEKKTWPTIETWDLQVHLDFSVYPNDGSCKNCLHRFINLNIWSNYLVRIRRNGNV